MKKIQRPVLKILLLAIAAIFFAGKTASAQLSYHRLRTADSLFAARQYKQSLDHYRVLLENRQHAPAMLLKMAFIQEGLNQTGEALYYLNLYYESTRDEEALEKMEDLAAKYNLTGYGTSAPDRLWTLYIDNHFKLSIALAAILFLLFSLTVYQNRKKRKGVPLAVAMILLAIAAAVHVNFGKKDAEAIITNNTSYLMSGPSSGADLISIVTSGHKVRILGKKDVWLKINWDGRVAYIRESNLLPVAL